MIKHRLHRLKKQVTQIIHSRPENRTLQGADEKWPLSISLQETAGFSPRSFIFLITCGLLLITDVYAKPIPSAPTSIVYSNDLIEHAKDYDGKVISFRGEVVGDIMKRGNFAWINVHDGQNALGIWAKLPLIPAVTFTGGYKSTGDIIEVRGVFHRACLEHGGDLDIHAESLTVIKPGQKRFEVLHARRKNLSLALMGVAICLLILRAWRRK